MQDWFPVYPGEIIAGVLGGVLRAIARRDLTGWQIASSLVAGALCAAYLTPLLTGFLADYGVAVGVRPHGTAAFLVGLGGLSFAQGLQTAIARWWERKSGPANGGQP